MAVNRRKQFEDKFKHDWLLTVSGSMCYRLYDTTSGYKAISNVGNFICYKYPFIYSICGVSPNDVPESLEEVESYVKQIEEIMIQKEIEDKMKE